MVIELDFWFTWMLLEITIIYVTMLKEVSKQNICDIQNPVLLLIISAPPA